MKCLRIICWMLFCTILAGAGCSRSGDEDAKPGADNGVQVVLRDHPAALTNWAQIDDPVTAANWPGEFYAAHASKGLTKLQTRIPAIAQGLKLDDLFTESFQISGWQRSQLQPLYAHDQEIVALGNDLSKTSATVWSNAAGDSPLSTADAWKKLMQPWSQCSQIKFHFEIEDVTVDDKNFTTHVNITLVGLIPNTGSRQATMTWVIRWTMPEANQESKMESLRIARYDEASLLNPAGTLFRDCTGSIFKSVESYEQQLAVAATQWTKKLGTRRIRAWNGVAICDVNNDSLEDFYVCQGLGIPNRLYIQNPDGSVKDVSIESGTAFSETTSCVLFADLDNDSDEDLLLGLRSGLAVMVNDGRGKFHFKTMLFRAPNAVCIAVGDYDKDNDLDILASSYLPRMRPDADYPAVASSTAATNGGGITLYNNAGNFRFEDKTERVGLNTKRFATAAYFRDHDGDNDLDIFATSDFAGVEYFENKGDWFAKHTTKATFEQPGFYRGLDWLDLDSDGSEEMLVHTGTTPAHRRIANDYPGARGDWKVSKSDLQLLSRGGFSVDRDSQGQFGAAVEMPRAPNANHSLNSIARDLNGDGIDDIFVTNGGSTRNGTRNWSSYFWRQLLPRFASELEKDSRQRLSKKFYVFANMVHASGSFEPNRRSALWLNTGQNRLVDISAIAGLDHNLDSRAAAYVDWDHDGDWDILQSNALSPRVILYRNESKPGNFIKFQLRGTDSNRDAIGSKVKVFLKGNPNPLQQTLFCRCTMLCQSSRVVLFSLPPTAEIDKVEVTWSDGKVQEYADLKTGQMFRLIQNQAEAIPIARQQPATRFVPGAATSNLDLVTESRVWPKIKGPLLEIKLPENDKWQDFVAGQKMTLVHLWRKSDSNLRQNLAQLQQLDERYRKVALCCDDSDAYVDAKNVESATLAPSSFDKLRVFAMELFADSEHFATPCWILLDDDSRVTSIYSGKLDPASLERDANELASVTDDMYYPYPGFEHRQISNLLVPDYQRLAECYGRTGYLDESKRMLQYTRPQTAIGYCQQAQAYIERNQFPEAMVLIKKATDANPNCREAYLLMGKLELLVSRGSTDSEEEYVERASQYFERVLQIDPENIDARLGLANLAEMAGNYDEALVILDVAIQKNDEQKLVIDQKYRLYWIKGKLYAKQRKFHKSAEALITAFDLRPIEVDLVTDLALVYASANDFENAARFFLLAQKLAPQHAPYAKMLGTCRFILGKYPESVEMLEKAILLASRDHDSRLMLAWILSTAVDEKLRDGKRALEIVEPLADIFGERLPVVLEVHAAALAENGDFKQAVKVQQDALSLSKSNQVPVDKIRPDAEMKVRLDFYKKGKPMRMTDPKNHPFPRIISTEGLYARQ